jgi:NAD(P)-dependent dehydrogenase (short-subunit alcohol dehydrogenase family)
MPELYSIHADISTIDGCHSFIQKVHDLFDKENGNPTHLDSLDILLHNAGVFEPNHVLTKDGLEMTFAVNVMAPFVITSNLLSILLPKDVHDIESQSKYKPLQKRVIVTSSMSQCGPMGDSQWKDLQCHERPFSTHRTYSESKYMDALLAAEMATRLEDTSLGGGVDRITCNSLDPGTVNTKMLLAGWGPCGIDVEDALGKILFLDGCLLLVPYLYEGVVNILNVIVFFLLFSR